MISFIYGGRASGLMSGSSLCRYGLASGVGGKRGRARFEGAQPFTLFETVKTQCAIFPLFPEEGAFSNAPVGI